jgi:putative ABC transport system permease protein
LRRWFETVWQDLWYAIRAFRRSPGFSLVALLSLTLGIGASSAIFSVIYGVIITPYPYARPHEIWAPQIRGADGRSGRGAHTIDEFLQISRLPAFADVMATGGEAVLLTGEFAPESFRGVLLSGNALNFLGVPPVIGRTIQPSDIRPDGQPEPVVVLSHRLWMRLFQGDRAAIGKTLRLNGTPHTIIGVMPPRFGWYGNDSFWLPLGTTQRAGRWVNAIVRLSPGVTKRAAEEQLHAYHMGRAKEDPAAFPAQGFTTILNNYLDVTVASGEMRTSLLLLLGAVGFLLLIACANVANLQLARGTARSREFAVRLSIGADRTRLLRQLLTESVLLSLAGGVAGVLFAFGAIKAVVALMPEFYVPNEARVAINTPVLLFSLVISVLTGIVFGLVPALQASRPDVTDALKKAGRSTGAGSDGSRTRNLLIVVEVALSVVLLAGAALTVRTFLALQNVDVGILTDRVLMVGVPLPPARYATFEQRNLFSQQLLERVSGLPGVEAATLGNGGLPFGGLQTNYTIEGQSDTERRRVAVNLVGADYLRTFGIPLRRGRTFEAKEVARGDRIALVNEAALRLWPTGQDPIGTRMRLAALEAAPDPSVRIASNAAPEVTIVGVIANTRNSGLRNEPAPVILIPYTLIAPSQRTLAIRSAGDPMLLLNPVREQVRALDQEQPLGRPITLDEVLGFQRVQPRFTMALFSFLAALGLALAAAGIYSVLSFHVTRRTQEIGVRMALGARPDHVLTLMLAMGGRLVLAGLAVGVPVSLAATQLLRSQLFGVTPADPVAYVAVAVVLSLVALVACYIPARRAAAVDPMVALREE